jgi:hypothetical protein
LEEDQSLDVSAGLLKLFDWHLHFFQHIPKSQETDESLKLLRRIENNKKW